MKIQSLEPAAAHLCLGIEKFLLEDLRFDPQGKEFILAYSGGADSKALLFILLVLQPRLGFTLSLAHLDHAFRATSAEELTAARLLAEEYTLDFYGKRLAPTDANRMGKEEAGRKARQSFFAELRAGRTERWIITGHQLNDLAEDILMRLLRGSGWPALGGMQAVDLKNRLLRPLLLTPRKELEKFLVSLKQDWLNDPMNEDRAFLRNRVRAELVPLFLRENPAFLQSCAALWQLARLDQTLFEQELKLPLLAPDNKLISDEALRKLPKALRLRVYKQALDNAGPGQVLLRNLLALDQTWENRHTGATIQFPGKKTARVVRQGISFA
jgi:tRNA(Ile)-lysidine synthase